MSQPASMPRVDQSARGTLVVRFRSSRPTLWFFGGMIWLFAAAYGFTVSATGTGPGEDDGGPVLFGVGVVMALAIAYLMFRVAFRRFARAGRSGNVALAIDQQGVHLGAELGGQPLFVPWPDVAGVSYLSWSSGDDGKTRHGVGVRVRPGRPGSPEEVFARLGQLQSRSNLTKRQRRSLAVVVDTARTKAPDSLLTASLAMRDWRVSEQALRGAVAAFRPDVPVTRDSGGGGDRWLKHRDRLPR